MIKNLKRISVLLFAAAVIAVLIPLGMRTASAKRNYFNITPYAEGTVGGNAMLGHTFSFNPESVIAGYEEMMDDYFTYGDPEIRSVSNGEYEDFDQPLMVDSDGICRLDLPNNIYLAGKGFRIFFTFGSAGGEDSRWETTSISTLYDIEQLQDAVLPLADKTYNGKPQTQNLSQISADGEQLLEDTDYWVEYEDNVNAGTATVNIHGQVKFFGTITKTFKINKAANPLTVKGKTAVVAYSKLKNKAVTLKIGKVVAFTKKGQGKMTYIKKCGNPKITINKNTGKVTIKKGLPKGTYKVKIKMKAAGNSNYNPSAWKKVTFRIKVN